MAKTNKEFRSDLAKEMFDKLQQRNEQLEKIEKSPYSEWVKEQMRKEIMENFYEQMDKMKERPWYEEAKKSHIAEIKAKHSLDIAREKRNRLRQEKERLEMELHNADNDVVDKWYEYNKSQINHGWELENDSIVPDEIQLNRKNRRENMYLNKVSMNPDHDAQKVKMMECIDKLPVKWGKEFIWDSGIRYSNHIEFRLWNKKYKILLPESALYDNWWVTYSDLNEVKNEEVKKYLKEKGWKWFHLPKKDQVESILQELGKLVNINDETDEIAMLSYLLGMRGATTYLLDGDFDIFCDWYPGFREIEPRRNSIMIPKKLFLIKEEK